MEANSGQPTDLARWVQRQNDRKEWSAADFARRLDANPGTVSRWITGARIPWPEAFDHIADALGIDVDCALTVAGHKPNIFELDPESPEGRLYSLIRKIQWDAMLLASFEAQLRSIIDVQRGKR